GSERGGRRRTPHATRTAESVPRRRRGGSSRRWSRRPAGRPCAWRTSRYTAEISRAEGPGKAGDGELQPAHRWLQPSVLPCVLDASAVQRRVDQRRDDLHSRVLGVVAIGRLLDPELTILADELLEEAVHPDELAVALVALAGRPLEVLPPVVLLLHLLASVAADEGDDGAAVAVVDLPLPRDEVAPVAARRDRAQQPVLVHLPERQHAFLAQSPEALVGEAGVVVVAAVARVREVVLRELVRHHEVDAAEISGAEARDLREDGDEPPGLVDRPVEQA